MKVPPCCSVGNKIHIFRIFFVCFTNLESKLFFAVHGKLVNFSEEEWFGVLVCGFGRGFFTCYFVIS